MSPPGLLRRRSIDGTPLGGNLVMRLVHFDESGIANVQDEPRVVIAGTIIEPDRQYKQLEDHLALLAGRYVPPEKHSQFVAFHATDLFNCEGKIFSKKDGWTLEKTAPIIRKLLRIPWRYGLPIVYGTWNRAKYLPSDSGPQHKHRSQHVKEATERAYSIAFIQALLRVNLWMHRHARRDEVVMVVVEDNRDMRKLVSKALLMLRYPALITPEFRPYRTPTRSTALRSDGWC